MVSRHCGCARRLHELLEEEAGITVINEVVLNQLAIVFGENEPLAEQNRLTDAVIAELAEENTFYVTGADWQDRKIMRVSITSRRTDTDDIDRLAASIVRAWCKVSTA